MMRSCERCDARFDGPHWQRLCWKCYQRRKANEQEAAYNRGFAAGRATAPAAPVLLEAELLTEAIALTHPDRHPEERSELANRVTARLLDAREAVAP
jgi:hypothetical protein